MTEDKPKFAAGGFIKGPGNSRRDRQYELTALVANLPPRGAVVVEVRVTGGVTIRRELDGTLDKLPALAEQAKLAAVRAALAAAESLNDSESL
jgi:hypothetical protein